MAQRALRMGVTLIGVALVTFVGYRLVSVNATTQGFAYLLLVLAIASTWGFVEASVASIAATLAFNFYFFEPIGTFTIEDPRNWAALFSFIVTCPDRQPAVDAGEATRAGRGRAPAGFGAAVHVQPLHFAD